MTKAHPLKYANYKAVGMAIENMKDQIGQHVTSIDRHKTYYKVTFKNIDVPAFVLIESNDKARGIHYCEANEKGVSCVHSTVLATIADKLGYSLSRINIKSSLADVEKFAEQFEKATFENVNTEFGLLPIVEEPEEEEETPVAVATTAVATTTTVAMPTVVAPTNLPRDWKKGWNKVQQYLMDEGLDIALIHKVCERRQAISNDVPVMPYQLPPKEPNMPYTGRYLERAIMHILMGKHLILIGDMGSGKDTLINTLGWVFNMPSVVHGSSGSDTKDSIIGDPAFRNNESTFDFSPLAKTVQYGGIGNIAEVNVMEGDTTSVFHSLFDENEVLTTPVGAIPAHEHFLCIGTLNVGRGYSGVKKLNAAFKDRFAVMRLPQGLNFKDMISKKTGLMDATALNFLESVKSSLEELFFENRGLDAKTIRGFIDAARLFVEYGFNSKTKEIAVEDFIINKEEDEEDYFELRSAVRMAYPTFPVSDAEQAYMDSLQP